MSTLKTETISNLNGDYAVDVEDLVSTTDTVNKLLTTDDITKGVAVLSQASVVLDSISALQTAKQDETQAVVVSSYYAGVFSTTAPASFGGGVFKWSPNTPRTSHNGGTVISPTVTWDGTTTTLADFLAGTNETSSGSLGCWVRVWSGKIDATWFGGFNNTAANAAIAYAYTTTSNRCVYLPSGTWNISAPLLLPSSNIHIVGDGAKSTVLRLVSGASYGIDIGGDSFVDTISVRDLTIDGMYLAGVAALIRTRKAQKKLTFEGLEFTRGTPSSAGLLATECWGMNVLNSHFYYCGRGADISGANNAVIQGNYFWNTSRENLVLRDSSNVGIRCNAFESYGMSGHGSYWNINFSSNVFSCSLENNWLETSTADNSHINISSTCSRIKVSYNTIYGQSLASHMVGCDAPSCEITHNRMSMSNPSFNQVRLGASALRTEVSENSYSGTSTPLQDNTGGNYFGDRKIELYAAATYDPPSIAVGSASSTTINVAGAALGDSVRASFNQPLSGVLLSAWVSSAGVVTVRFQNDTPAAVDLPSGVLRVTVTKS